METLWNASLCFFTVIGALGMLVAIAALGFGMVRDGRQRHYRGR